MIKTPMTRDIVGDKDPWTLRKELNAVDAPGGVHVRRTLLNRFGEPRDVANTALFLAGEEGSYFTGSILHPDGGVALG
jgi:NAD(P)-dependent dehydrogenase (short-subunit alcohol dehydrogenase family)